MNIEREVEFIIKQLKDGRYIHAEHTLKKMNEELERKKTGFDRSNICPSCQYLSKGDCTATEEYRKNKKINSTMNCQFHYEMIKYMDFIFNDPEEIKKREELSRQLSQISVEELFRPFTI